VKDERVIRRNSFTGVAALKLQVEPFVQRRSFDHGG
jgi:hypothetical protein